MFKFIKKLFDSNAKALTDVEPIVEEIFANEQAIAKLSDNQLKQKVIDFREEIKELVSKAHEDNIVALKRSSKNSLPKYEKDIQTKLQSFIPQFFAIMREVNKRKFGKPHYKVQLTAATILAQGHKLTELKTGEGKTQVFHLPAALYGLTGRGSHVITVNDYLAKRDGEYAGHAMADLGISVGIITPQAAYKFVCDNELQKIKGDEAVKERKKLDVSAISAMKGVNLITCEKKEAYAQDVVYGTNNEFGFDYLRDNMTYDIKKRVQSELYFVIIDEADSILIDEARTPLIISAPAAASGDMYSKFAKLVKQLNRDLHYVVDEKAHSATLTEEGVEYAEKLLNVSNIWENHQMAHHLDNALKAESLYQLDDEYIIKNGEIMIVDEFTGRVLGGRRYSDGLHQAIEAKEGVDIKKESKTMATITFQNFFRLYKVIAGGSGTIMTEAEEFLKIYDLESLAVPTNKPVIRKDKTDKVYKNKNAKFNAVVEEIIKINKTGQPILVGTTSVEASEYVSRQLDKKGVTHEVLNAKFHQRESQIVAKAGFKTAVTVATNMAGRGTDIPISKEVQKIGGLNIIGTERHDARRVDNQLRGRAGRQGEPGSSQFFISLDDQIMRIQGGEIVQRLMNMSNLPDDYPIESGMIGRSIESAQKKMEGHHFDIRKRLVDYDDVMNQQREIFYTRRYNLLKLTDDLTSDDDKTVSTAKNEIIKAVKEIFSKEIESIVYKHQMDSSEKSNITSIIQEYLDLGNDDEIFKAYSLLTGDKSKIESSADLTKLFVNKLSTKSDIKIIEFLNNIITKLVDIKAEEFDKKLGEIYKITTLQFMDQLWTDHLNRMGDLREGIGLRGYAQRDPLVEYKNEGFEMFQIFISAINSKVSRRLLKVRKVVRSIDKQKMQTNENQVSDVLTGTREMNIDMQKALSAKQKNIKTEPQKTILKDKEPGRNDPCPCGSGKKWKKCGMIEAESHKG